MKANQQIKSDAKYHDLHLSSDNATFVPDTTLNLSKRNALINSSEKNVNSKLASMKLFGSSGNIGVVFYENENSKSTLDDVFNTSKENYFSNQSSDQQLQRINKFRLNAPPKNSFIRSPPMQIKALSLDSNRKYANNRSKTYNFSFDKALKMRSYSDTQNPLIDDQILLGENETNENDAGRKRNKYRRQKDFPMLSPILGDHCAKQKDEHNVELPRNNRKPEKTELKSNRRWIRKISRYPTCDESTIPESIKPVFEPIVRESKKNIEETQSKNLSFEQQTRKEGSIGRKISTGKMIKQSMSQGFSKFKQLSMSGKNSGRKLEHYYSVIENDEGDHETSHRIEPLEKINDFTGIEEKESISSAIFRRCSSLPDCLDSTSAVDEQPDNLYLPRRMAICPDLAVPAMKQLRTYLVLNRLKQYCIV